MLLATPDELAARRAATEHSLTLRALLYRLRSLLEPMLGRTVSLPRQKPLLSRDGGNCETDGSRLVFDPVSPELHRCPRCDRTHRGERHHRAWIWRYHLWLSERAIHLALLAALSDDVTLARRSWEILAAYADLYPRVPNQDNVLGPTRLFFSTYLESIWLTQMLAAASLLESGGSRDGWDDLEPVVRESAALIASFDEGWSNRQVWNNLALIAAGRWLSDEGLLVRGLNGTHGIRAQLRHAVTRDGLWFEGENYHFFALRGFLLAAEVLRTAGIDLYGDGTTGPQLSAMYVAPLDTVLPDLTIPARADAPFGVSLLQPRFAELWEIGRARVAHPRLESLLTHLYSADAPEAEDAGFAEIAEQEQNRPAARLSRDRLGWKALLWMDPQAPHAPVDDWRPTSRLLVDAGVAVMRHGDRRYVSLECGGMRGGHGHPDLLHLTVFADRPILADFGTGSYVTPSLHWYRSTLAHNAPGLAGVGQLRRNGWCSAFDTVDGWAWSRAEAGRLFGNGTSARRTVVSAPQYVVDVVEVEVPSEVEVELPIHPLSGAVVSEWGEGGAGAPSSSAATHHGYSDLVALHLLPPPPRRFALGPASDSPELLIVPRSGETLFVAAAPGPPSLELADGAPLTFLVRRARGAGCWVQLFAPHPRSVSGIELDDGQLTVRLPDGSAEQLRFQDDTLMITDAAGRERTLRGALDAPPLPEEAPPPSLPSLPCSRVRRVPPADQWWSAVPSGTVVQLGARHYRRSEAPYGSRGQFVARVAVFVAGSRVCFAAEVTKSNLCFRPVDAPDPSLDNEAPDIHSDGLQCYVGLGHWAGYVAVPNAASTAVHVRPVAGTAADVSRASGSWAETDAGYSIVVAVDVGRRLRAGDCFPVNLVVNEMYPERERRAGQLVLSGGVGWVYLRGDREGLFNAVMAEVS
ncbi:MAG: hypothetical protein GTN62_14660 [Gemmatimonadales bacterium]|nr:hypothetical protein [Gemmatimonadales bacterium]NIN13326.1 hypothetical protein [Gemmatimonadales bacterium]NIN51329.1 hypothetical protein [Gemmatimonadales bacterium]NIP08793.1 hypothetical protein [Gemmatimonadales bacterium]NIQ99787.1 hypothetical protein [Gemmatimonadales bacterium]